MKLKGYVEKIIYSNSNNGHAILSVSLTNIEVERLRKEAPAYENDIEDEMVCVGPLYLINQNMYVEFEGDFVVNPSHGLQFKAVSYVEEKPEDLEAIERYLGSGAIKGIGVALAGRIVRHFKLDTMRVIENNPEELSAIKGISQRMAMEIGDQVIEKKAMRNAMIFLGKLGITMNLSVKIYNKYGESLYDIVKNNPYRLADDIEGVGFKTADDIAKSAGIESNSQFRIKSGIVYTISQAMALGHTYLPKEELYQQSTQLLGIEIEHFDDILMELVIDRKILVKKINEETAVYGYAIYNTELRVAANLTKLSVKGNVDDAAFDEKIRRLEAESHMELDERQRLAVKEAVANGLLVITGGPGTGKTTTINTIIRYFESRGDEILLAAPTGRAAKRMKEATKHEAQTIHRMLELSGVLSDSDSSGACFEKNEDNPLEADVIIIDEMSMVDIFLMNSLLKAISVGTRLILVGDANQLPSVGPGNVLRDIIASDCFAVVELTRIFRQSEAGDIINNAHKINKGELFEVGTNSKDFPFITRDSSNAIINAMVTLVRDKLPAYTQSGINDIQILTPSRISNLGVEKLNAVMQDFLNPPSRSKVEKELNGVLFREGDKVMQIKNNYNITWEIRGFNGITADTGMGVFNGDTGIIDNINLFLGQITVRFEDNKYVTYSFKEADELEHAYAVTVHKSQGSEYPAVVLPLLDVPRMLKNRNILYTAVTRAKKCICVVGSRETFYEMIKNESEQKRYSSLAIRIREVYQ